VISKQRADPLDTPQRLHQPGEVDRRTRRCCSEISRD
jgi:hypothetical protein